MIIMIVSVSLFKAKKIQLAENQNQFLIMANSTYDNLWNQAIGELSEQLNVEGADEEGGEDGGGGQKEETREVTIFQAFQHFACLYIKYLQIFRKLECCYDW